MSEQIIQEQYQAYMRAKEHDWEALCRRCGGCCGAFDDPCRHLKRDSQGKTYCEIYDKRFGLRETVNNDKFNCVHIREILSTHWKNDHICAYKRKQNF